MILTVPPGVTQVFGDDGQLIAVVNGQIDVEPHLVAGLLARGFVAGGSDALTSDSASPAAVADSTQGE